MVVVHLNILEDVEEQLGRQGVQGRGAVIHFHPGLSGGWSL